MISTICMPTGIRYPNDIFGYHVISGWWPRSVKFSMRHSRKLGPKDRPTLDNIDPHDIIIDYQFD